MNGYSPWILIICLRLGGIIAHCAEEMGKGKPGNLTAHLFGHDIRVPEVEANPNARVDQLVHGLLNGAEAARNGWVRRIICQRERIIAISEEGEENAGLVPEWVA